MRGRQAMEEGASNEEVSARFAEMQPNHDIDAIKQNRGMLSFRSRKMLNLFHKTGGGGQVERKKISGPVSARDVKLEVVPNPPQQQLSVEPQKEDPKKKILESKKTVRTVVTRKGSSLLHGHLQEKRENGKLRPEANNASPPRVVIDDPVYTAPKRKQLLPPRLKLLETFYAGLEAAISLLAIRRQICTFKTVCKAVEQMSKRRFLRSHLAQLKFLFPEAIEIDYVRAPDQDSRREMWDLRISLKSYQTLPGGSPLKGAASPSRDKNAQTLRRKREFHSRLLKFATSHNEDVEVPQDPLPQRPLGGQSISSPNVSAAESPSIDFVSNIKAGNMKQSPERNLDAASPVTEGGHLGVAETPNDSEYELPSANRSEEVLEFCVVKAGPVIFPDVDITSHFPSSFKPHFQERGRELNSMEKPESRDFLDIGLTSHFAPSFKSQFQERHREFSSKAKSSSSTVPGEVHLQTSAISSRIITHFSSSSDQFFKSTEEGTREDFSQASESAEVQENSLLSSASGSERASSKCLTAELNSSTPPAEKNPANAGESSAAGDGEDPPLKEFQKTFSEVQSPIRNASGDVVLASTPATEMSSVSPAMLSPVSERAAEMAQDIPHFHQSLHCATPAPSTSVTTESVPNTPYTGGRSIDNSPAAAQTPASLSPSRHYQYQYVQDSPISEHLKKKEASSDDQVPLRSQGTIRSLKFGSPVRPHLPSQKQAEDLGPSTPQVGAVFESTPRDESKYTPLQSLQSPFPTSQITSPEASLGKASYFSPVRPQRSRALRFSTPEKVRDHEASVAKLGTPSSSEQQHFKSPPATGSAMKPPRFMSPPKAQTLSAPATPVPTTPVRSILYSPPKRTKLNRGSLFSNHEQEEEMQVPPHTLVAEGEKVETRTDSALKTPYLDLGSETLTPEETFSTPVKDSPWKTRKALDNMTEADLAIIHSLPAELVHSVREKERKMKDENMKEIMVQKKRQQMMAGLPKMFNQLRLIFQSLKRSVLPRNELIKNVLSTNADITDRVEVEERLKLLIELAPDWITKQPSANGDYIYRINKTANVTKIQKKILEAC